jgi:hypothetical protein
MRRHSILFIQESFLLIKHSNAAQPLQIFDDQAFRYPTASVNQTQGHHKKRHADGRGTVPENDAGSAKNVM